MMPKINPFGHRWVSFSQKVTVTLLPLLISGKIETVHRSRYLPHQQNVTVTSFSLLAIKKIKTVTSLSLLALQKNLKVYTVLFAYSPPPKKKKNF
jgi:hypothetical protein